MDNKKSIVGTICSYHKAINSEIDSATNGNVKKAGVYININYPNLEKESNININKLGNITFFYNGNSDEMDKAKDEVFKTIGFCNNVLL